MEQDRHLRDVAARGAHRSTATQPKALSSLQPQGVMDAEDMMIQSSALARRRRATQGCMRQPQRRPTQAPAATVRVQSGVADESQSLENRTVAQVVGNLGRKRGRAALLAD
jgi:hypothetical protein